MATTTPATTDIASLDRLAGLGMGMAQRLHDVALETDDREHLARLGAAFQSVSRGVRQTIALKARLLAGWMPTSRPEPVAATAPPAPETAAPERPARMRAEATHWDEYERLDDEELADELDRLIESPEHEPIDLERLSAALEAGVARIQRGAQALRPRPTPSPKLRMSAATRAGPRASLLNSAAGLRIVNSS